MLSDFRQPASRDPVCFVSKVFLESKIWGNGAGAATASERARVRHPPLGDLNSQKRLSRARQAAFAEGDAEVPG